MRKNIIIAIFLSLSLLSACSNQMSEGSNNTVESGTALALTESSFTNKTVEEASDTEPVETEASEEETTPAFTVPDDLDYYEMYKNYLFNSEGVSDDKYQLHEKEDAKQWISTDGKISFILDTYFGPFSTAHEIDATYTVEGTIYDTKVWFEPNHFKMYVGTQHNCTILLSGVYEYNHEEQSFTVTTSHEIGKVYLDDKTFMSIDEYNANKDENYIPVYDGGSIITFKMVR